LTLSRNNIAFDSHGTMHRQRQNTSQAKRLQRSGERKSRRDDGGGVRREQQVSDTGPRSQRKICTLVQSERERSGNRTKKTPQTAAGSPARHCSEGTEYGRHLETLSTAHAGAGAGTAAPAQRSIHGARLSSGSTHTQHTHTRTHARHTRTGFLFAARRLQVSTCIFRELNRMAIQPVRVPEEAPRPAVMIPPL
jgi:hypothetical protein